MSVASNDFTLVNNWIPDPKLKWWGTNEPMYLIDESTGKCYWNESKVIVRIKCALLGTLGTAGNLLLAVSNIAFRVLRLVSLYHLWRPNVQFKARLVSIQEDFKSLVRTPFIFTGLIFSALYGLISPYDGRKLYASFANLANYTIFIPYFGTLHIPAFAPCFQPSPTRHFFGGDPTKQNKF